MSTWCDEALNTHALRVREAIAELSSALNSIEGTVLLTQEVNNESFWDDSHDHYMPQKVASFRDYLARLRGGIEQLKQIPREVAFKLASS